MADLDPASAPVGFDALYGLEMVRASPEEVVAELALAPHHLQPFGLVHGGVIATMAESTASVGTWLGVREAGMVALGQANATSFLRPVTGARLRATARPIHRGRSTWVWDVDATDAEGRRCAVTRMTVAVRRFARPASRAMGDGFRPAGIASDASGRRYR